MIRTRTRRARKLYYCEDCRGMIQRGDRYRNIVASPDHDGLGNLGWWRLRICVACRPEEVTA